ncbi:mCG1034136, partial [Mus musculus]
YWKHSSIIYLGKQGSESFSRINDLKKKRNSEALHATTDIFHQPESCAKCFFSLTKGQSAHSLRPQLVTSLLCQSPGKLQTLDRAF